MFDVVTIEIRGICEATGIFPCRRIKFLRLLWRVCSKKRNAKKFDSESRFFESILTSSGCAHWFFRPGERKRGSGPGWLHSSVITVNQCSGGGLIRFRSDDMLSKEVEFIHFQWNWCNWKPRNIVVQCRALRLRLIVRQMLYVKRSVAGCAFRNNRFSLALTVSCSTFCSCIRFPVRMCAVSWQLHRWMYWYSLITYFVYSF